jgi:hypothetical protein
MPDAIVKPMDLSALESISAELMGDLSKLERDVKQGHPGKKKAALPQWLRFNLMRRF